MLWTNKLRNLLGPIQAIWAMKFMCVAFLHYSSTLVVFHTQKEKYPCSLAKPLTSLDALLLFPNPGHYQFPLSFVLRFKAQIKLIWDKSSHGHQDTQANLTSIPLLSTISLSKLKFSYTFLVMAARPPLSLHVLSLFLSCFPFWISGINQFVWIKFYYFLNFFHIRPCWIHILMYQRHVSIQHRHDTNMQEVEVYLCFIHNKMKQMEK